MTKKSKYVITSAQLGANVNKKMLMSVEKYCAVNSAELLVLPMKGKYKEDEQVDENLFNCSKIITKNYKLNDNININNFEIRPQQIQPTTGLARFVTGDKSFIFASPKQELKVIPNSKSKTPKILLTPGAITNPYYKTHTRIGRIAKLDHRMGFIVVEIEDNKNYHFRHVAVAHDGSFIDLGSKYNGSKPVSKVNAEALVLGDWHTGETNKSARDGAELMIKEFKPKFIMLHDLFNGKSISHHSENKLLDKYNDYQHSCLDLDKELQEVNMELEWFESICKSKIVVVKSNHDEWLKRYINEARFITEPQNAVISSKILTRALEGEDPFVAGLKLAGLKSTRVKFLKRDDDFSVRGVKLGHHGDIVAKGMRGSLLSKEVSIGKSVMGHQHEPQICRDVFHVGTNTHLNLDYTKGASSWMHTNALVYPNGKVQLINIMNGKYRG